MDGERYNTNTNQKRVAIFISNGADFRARNVIRDKEEYYVIIKTPHQRRCTDDR